MLKIQNFKETKTCLKDLIAFNDKKKTCILQKKSSNRWMEQSIPKNQNNISNIQYDEFIYTDKLTKKKIRMRDAKNSYQNQRHVRNSSTIQMTQVTLNQQKKKRQHRLSRHKSNNQLQKQLTDLNQCFIMLKSTEMFKMNSLRQKIFGSVDRTFKNTPRNNLNGQKNGFQIDAEEDNLIAKKKKIRQILEDSVKQANMKQFREYYTNENHKLNHKIISMNKHIPKSFNKSNIQKIIETLSAGEKQNEKFCRLIDKSSNNVQFPGEQKLKWQLLQYMRKQIKQNGEYLIVPQKKKLLFQRLYHNVNKKNQNSQNNQIQTKKKNKIIQNNTHDSIQLNSTVQIDLESDKTIISKKDAQTNFNKMFDSKSKTDQKKVKFGQNMQKNRKQKHKKQNTCINFNFRQNKQNSFDRDFPESKVSPFLKEFAFRPCENSKQVQGIKSRFQRHIKLSTKPYNLKEQRFLFLVQNGLLFDVEKQSLMNENYLFLRDKNLNNLFHICAKNHNTQMFNYLIERLRKTNKKQNFWQESLIKTQLLQKNKNNKNVLDTAKIYQAKQIIQSLVNLKHQFNIKQLEI